MPDRAKVYMGHQQPATGSHLPLEDTALPCAAAPLASPPFAHPIPQSHRRASEDLFSASLRHYARRIRPYFTAKHRPVAGNEADQETDSPMARVTCGDDPQHTQSAIDDMAI
ncbi:MAG: hypothetical protein J0I90_06930 [Nitrosospira sp.]|nr:hypothetical protein [Nitrosospira sp.]